MNPINRTATTTWIALALGLGAPTAAIAQSTPATPESQQMAAPPSEEEIQAFAVATAHIIEIQQSAQQRIATASDPNAAEAVRQEARLEINAVVDQVGLSVPEYNAIAEQTRSDPELAEDVQSRIEEQLGN